MYTLEGVSSVQASLLLMKSLNKTEIPIFLSVVCSLFPKAIFFDVYIHCPVAFTATGKCKFIKEWNLATNASS